MNKIAQYLQEHLAGEVMDSADARKFFSTDTSIFKIAPQVIVYPRVENDIRKTARFAWQLAERGRNMPITARGLGTDQGGGAIGEGLIVAFPAHMNKLLNFDSGKNTFTIQPGLNYGKLQQTLQTHGLFLPPFPSSSEYSTVGGAIANDSAGIKSIKYGTTKDYIKSLRVVLANGEIINTARINKRELSHKMGLATFEGEIYRSVDAILEDNKKLIAKRPLNVTQNVAGYNIWGIKQKDGSIDLTPLFVGSQGTLGVIVEATLSADVYNPKTSLIAAFFDDTSKAGQAALKLRELAPSALEMIDGRLLNFLDKHNPSQLKNLIKKPFPSVVLLVEFDDISKRSQHKKIKKATRILKNLDAEFKVAYDQLEQEDLWKIRHSSATVVWQQVGSKKALPIVEDGIVPAEKLSDYISNIYKLFENYHLDVAIWGHAGSANLKLRPFLDLTQVGDRQMVFKLMDAYYRMIIAMGGSTTAEHNDGRLRAPYLKALYGPEIYEVFQKIKQTFDPYAILNPGVKIDVSIKDLQPLVRHEYSLDHLYSHMPRS